jgi:hypothetical protein
MGKVKLGRETESERLAPQNADEKTVSKFRSAIIKAEVV